MNQKRRLFLVSSLLVTTATFTASLTGCTFELLEVERHHEEVSSVLISKDEKKLVFMNDEHHYIFDADPKFIALLKSPLHPLVTLDNGPAVHVTDTGKAMAIFGLQLPANVQEGEAIRLGFKKV